MSRYSIALNKSPEEIQREQLVTRFGFDKEINSNFQRTFFLKIGEITRAGIIYDDPESLFYCAKVHYYKTHKFFCKSTKGHLAYCCELDYPGRKPAIRIATILAQYKINTDNVGIEDAKVIPWVFGSIMFEKIKEMHSRFSVINNDFLIKCPDDRALRFKNYEIMPVNTLPLWETMATKHRLLEVHSYIKKNIRNYFANDYSEKDISNIISGSLQM